MSTVILIVHIWTINQASDEQVEEFEWSKNTQWTLEAVSMVMAAAAAASTTAAKRRMYISQALNKHGKKSSWNKRIMFAVSAIYIDYFDETN